MSVRLPFNTARTTPKLKDLLDLVKRDVLLTLNCHHLATIASFDTSAQTVQAQINYERTISDDQGNQTSVAYPVLVDVPAVSLCGGAVSLTFGIKKGDQALILFNDRDIDNWLSQRAAGGQVNSPRLHSFADGIALVGLNKVSSWDAVRALITDGTVKLGVNPSNHKVTLTNGTSLNTVLQAITALTSSMQAIASSENSIESSVTAILTTLVTNLVAFGALTALQGAALTASITAANTSIASNATAIGNVPAAVTASNTQIGGLLEA